MHTCSHSQAIMPPHALEPDVELRIGKVVEEEEEEEKEMEDEDEKEERGGECDVQEEAEAEVDGPLFLQPTITPC